MSLLEDPLKSLDQIDWYISNRDKEKFPGAFLIAAGNLARHVIEQTLFILAFYSGLPHSKYLKKDNCLRNGADIYKALRLQNPLTGRTYFEQARLRGPRIRKFARNPRSLDRWRKLFNEPSHFRNPAARRKTREREILSFVERMRNVIDPYDCHLITAAVNELRSGGRIRAVLSNNPQNSPGIGFDVVVTPKNIEFLDGKLTLRAPGPSLRVIPDTHEVPHRWVRLPVIVQHSEGISIESRLVTEDGDPVDLTNMETILLSLARTPEGRARLERRLKKLGIEVK